jgi:microcystin-dependent protein
MSEAYIGEIRIFAGNFAPQNWALCNGQLLSISQNTALFSILGTTYGGDGKTTFALPNLQSCVPVHQGQGAGLSPYVPGQRGGSETVTLNSQQMPQHNHTMGTLSAAGTAARPNTQLLAQSTSGNVYGPAPSDGSALNQAAIGMAGGNQPHPNIQPYLALTFIICLYGIFPPRS